MTETNETAAPPEAPAARSPGPAQDAPTPQLPASFFSKLVRQPKCITEGVCNNCGRCEH